jgi:hypothetical protein
MPRQSAKSSPEPTTSPQQSSRSLKRTASPRTKPAPTPTADISPSTGSTPGSKSDSPSRSTRKSSSAAASKGTSRKPAATSSKPALAKTSAPVQVKVQAPEPTQVRKTFTTRRLQVVGIDHPTAREWQGDYKLSFDAGVAVIQHAPLKEVHNNGKTTEIQNLITTYVPLNRIQRLTEKVTTHQDNE